MMGFREKSHPSRWRLSGPPRGMPLILLSFRWLEAMNKAAHHVRQVSVLGIYLYLHSGFLLRGAKDRVRCLAGHLGTSLICSDNWNRGFEVNRVSFSDTLRELAFLLFFFPGVCMTFLSVSSVGSHKLAWKLCFTQSSPVAPCEAGALLRFPLHSLSTGCQGCLG